jgi:peptidyl-prolyl cis-trans isomerase C
MKARIDEQSPFVRSRFAQLDAKKELLDNVVRFELLAREAAKQGLEKDPDVQLMVKRMMVQKLVQKSFAEGDAAKVVSDAEAKQYYDAHAEEFHRPAKVRVAHILVKAPAEGGDRAKKEAAAKALLAGVKAQESKSPGAFMAAARDASEDEATKATGGDLGFRSQEELAAQLGPAAAEAAFGMKDGELSSVIPTAQGFVLLKRTGWQEPVDRPFDAVKAQLQAKLAREKRTKDFDAFVKKLKDDAKVQVDEAELAKIEVAAAPAAAAPAGMPPGMGGPGPGMMPPGHGGPGRAAVPHAPGGPGRPAMPPGSGAGTPAPGPNPHAK